jgi:hypothetical protein
VCKDGELTPEELEQLMAVVVNPRQFKVLDWFLNTKKDYKDGRFSSLSFIWCSTVCKPIWIVD